MRMEKGAVLKLIEYEYVVDGYAYKCEVLPKGALCKKCRRLRPDWYPQQPPTVRLNMLAEALVVPLIGVPVIHERLYDILRPQWPKVLTTRCSSHPESELKIGERYVCLSPPRKNVTDIMYPLGRVVQCDRCSKWMFDTGPGMENPYVVLTAEQEDEAAFVDWDTNDLLVNPPLRDAITQLGIGTIGWLTIPVFSEPLPQHVVPTGQGSK